MKKYTIHYISPIGDLCKAEIKAETKGEALYKFYMNIGNVEIRGDIESEEIDG